MPSHNNLTRTEAQERAQLLAVDTVRVDLDLTGDTVTFRSRSAITFRCASPGAGTFVNITAPAVLEITLNGSTLDPGEHFDGNRITLPDLAAQNELVVVADCAYMHTGEGLHRFVDPVDDSVYLYSQFETFDAHRMYACFDQPDLKAAFEFAVTAPAEWTVVSNSPAAVTEIDGARRWTFERTERISTYVTALVAGPYASVTDTYSGPDGDIALGLYCRRSLLQHMDADELFEVTKQGFDFFHSAFGRPYPFGAKYDQLFVPEFNAGAMENVGCVTILEDYLFRSKVTAASYERRAETILHEMAHMWFGDLVTMRWWDDLWLNESFASYMAVLSQASVTRYTAAWTTFANLEKTWAYRQDQLPSTHPVAAEIEDNDSVRANFDGITYAKGASVLKQLVAWVGQEEFLAGMREYFRRFAFGNTCFADLLEVLEQTSGRELSAWSREWFQTAGVNTLRPDFSTGADGKFSSFAVRQDAPAEHPTLRSHRVAIGLYDLTPVDEGEPSLVRRQRVEIDVVGAVTDVPQLVGAAQPDLVLVNDDDLTYAKIRLDPRSLATVTWQIDRIAESLPRALCWAAAWDMTRDGEMATRDYLTLVLGGIGGETDIGVVQSLLRQAQAAVDLYADPAYRATGLQRLADAAYEQLLTAVPGSDHQLAWARTFATSARSEPHVAVLRALLDGSRVVEGLAVDTDLRWLLLKRLVALGAAGEDDISAEEHRDRTAAGHRHAAAACAARPDPAAKAAAWASLVDRDELPMAVQAAVVSGFVSVEHRELLRPYAARYFEVIDRIWAERTGDVAHALGVGLYPGIFVEPETLERTDAFLRDRSPAPALARILVEGRDGVARALRAQQRDAAAQVVGQDRVR